MMVMPFTFARTSRRRFTLLKVFSAAAISSREMPQLAAIAAAAVIPHVVFARDRVLEVRPRFSIAPNRPCGSSRFQMQVRDWPSCIRAGAVALHRAKGASETAIKALAPIEGDDAAAARDEIHQPLKGRFHGVEVFVNICVIKFDRSQNDGVGKIMQKLWALVEESGVILIAFEDEVFALSQLKAAAKVFRDAANQERRLQAGSMKNPRQH